MKNSSPILVALLLSFTMGLMAQKAPRLFSPAHNSQFSNNMPRLVWEKQACTQYEIYLDGKLIDRLPATQNEYTCFPLSFGQHQWQVRAVYPTQSLASVIASFRVADKPLTTLPDRHLLLRDGWFVRSAAEVGNDGARLAGPATKTQGWAATSLPATVLTALVRNGVYPNPYHHTNNMRIPDSNDEFNKEYNLLQYSHIPGQNPWKKPYWYRTEFGIPSHMQGTHWWLNFSEINYKAQVWLNGKLVADTLQMKGMERLFRFEVSKLLNRKGKNYLAVAIFPPDNPGKPAQEPLSPLADPGQNMADGLISRDYTKWDVMGWDWQPSIRDRDMGITEEVWLSTTDPIELQDLYLSARMYLPDTTLADVQASALLINRSNQTQKGQLRLELDSAANTVVLEQAFELAANDTLHLQWTAAQHPSLRLREPRLWWPFGYGAQHLYPAKLRATTAQGYQSELRDTFGIRQIETYLGTKERVYKINGREIYIRGGNWVIDMMLNWNASRYEKEILLTRNANLNLLRIWGPTGVAPKALYRAADKYGVLLWQDFLNDFWGTFKNTPGFQPQIDLFASTTAQIIRKYRNHPSLIIWCGGNEGINPREELIMKQLLPQHDPYSTRHYLRQSDGDGLHGGGPYHTMRPYEYFTHPKLTGFSSEIGPSGVPVLESLHRFMPELGKNYLAGRFPLDGVWAYHDANNWPGDDTRKFTEYDDQLRLYYGQPDTSTLSRALVTYHHRAQAVNYDVYRASIEAINHQLWRSSSGVLLWKSNSSWPSLTWQVYDWYLQAHAGYYATRKAAAALHLQLNRHTGQVDAINLTAQHLPQCLVRLQRWSPEGRLLRTDSTRISLGANSARNTALQVQPEATVQFVRMELFDANGKLLATNVYWLQANNQFESLQQLAAPRLEMQVEPLPDARYRRYRVHVSNQGPNVAMLVQLKLVGKESLCELLPSLWSDNFVTLVPGESRTLEVSIDREDCTEEPALGFESYGDTTLRIVPIN